MAVIGALDSIELRAITTVPGPVREDLMAKIWDVSKVPLPFQDRIGTGTCESNVHEWVADKLGVGADNAWVENASIPETGTASGVVDIGNSAIGPYGGVAARFRNHCQIAAKVVTVSYRSAAIASAGNTGSLAYQLMMRQRELKQDMEVTLCSNLASVVGTLAAAPHLGGIQTWVRAAGLTSPTQAVFQSPDATPSAGGGYVFATGLTAIYDGTGTPAAITETLLRNVCQEVWIGGAEVTTALCRPGMKRIISQYMYTSSARIAQLTAEVGQAESGTDVARGAVSIFITDFGVIELVASRFYPFTTSTTHDSVLVFDPQYLSVDYLQNVTVRDKNAGGLADRRLMYTDYTLKVGSAQAIGMVGDLSPTAAMTA